MTPEQALIFAILGATIAMFLWGRWRHDMVAVAALLACVLLGLMPGDEAFLGFGHPAVITVACVLVLSRALQNSGAVDALAQRVLPTSAGPTLTIAALAGLAALLSAFMNNVGAMALLMPLAVQIAAKQQLPAGRVLMPLAFASILGGMTTMIGTPPNLIVSGFRAEVADTTFTMFDFTPVGVAVAGAGVLFVALIGWRLVPARERAGAGSFDTGAYLTEARVPQDSKAAGKPLNEIEQVLDEADAQVVGLVSGAFRVSAPAPWHIVQPGDILVIEAEPESLGAALASLGLELAEDLRDRSTREGTPRAGARRDGGGAADRKDAAPKPDEAGDTLLLELAVRPDAPLVGRTATDIRLRARYGINLLALSHQGRHSISRLRTTPIRAGDVLLMQGTPEALSAFASEFGCVPLAGRPIHIPDRRKTVVATLVMAAAVAGAAFGLLPAAITFAGGVLACMALGVISPRAVYEAIDWPVIVLLGALIPVAGAMAATGAADLIAGTLLGSLAQGNAVIALVVILVVTMTLSDFMNNAATAAMMCPIAISAAEHLGANPDSFLMAVAIGASCAFLTPIGHQNNTLILGPGGLKFGDYWRLGLPLELLVIAAGVPMLLIVWPL